MDRITAIAICEALLYELQPFDEQPKDAFQMALDALCEQEELGKELTNAVELIHKKNNRINELQRVIEEQKKQIQELKKRNNYLQSKMKDQRELIEAYKTGVRWAKRT